MERTGSNNANRSSDKAIARKKPKTMRLNLPKGGFVIEYDHQDRPIPINAHSAKIHQEPVMPSVYEFIFLRPIEEYD